MKKLWNAVGHMIAMGLLFLTVSLTIALVQQVDDTDKGVSPVRAPT